jgi:hypothetical protein
MIAVDSQDWIEEVGQSDTMRFRHEPEQCPVAPPLIPWTPG